MNATYHAKDRNVKLMSISGRRIWLGRRKMRKKLFLLSLLAPLIFLCLRSFTFNKKDGNIEGKMRQLDELQNNHFQPKGRKETRIDLPGCKVPVDVYLESKNNSTQSSTGSEPAVLKSKSKLKACDFLQPSFTFVKGNRIYLNATFKDASCCYRGIERIFGTDEHVEWSQECTPIPAGGATVHLYDATVIICEYGGTMFQNYHAVVRQKEKRFNSASPDLNLDSPTPKPNIFIIGLDSVSRTHFNQFMPHTARFLQEIGAFDFESYVKVGPNTVAAMVPILTGYTFDQISQFCYDPTKPVDSCPFLWHNLSMATAFLEDAPVLNAFNTDKFGFLKQPTDFYLRPLMLAVIKELYVIDNSIFHCVGSRSTESFILEYIEQLSLSSVNHPLFLFSWFTSLAHANPDHLPDADLLFSHHLSRLDLSNTILIVMSDHGFRSGETKLSFNGWYNDKLPFFTIAFPEKVMDFLGPAKLQIFIENTKKLTTPLDVYHTLVELMTTFNLGTFTDKNSLNFGSTHVHRAHGQSLFSIVSPDRNCQDAGVLPEFCPCRDLQPISVLDPIFNKASEIAIEEINSFLPPRCRKLKISKITGAGKFSEDEFVGGFLTSPGGWEVEMRFRKDMTNLKYNRISRIKRFSEAWCTRDHKGFCYCTILGLMKEFIYGA